MAFQISVYSNEAKTQVEQAIAERMIFAGQYPFSGKCLGRWHVSDDQGRRIIDSLNNMGANADIEIDAV